MEHAFKNMTPQMQYRAPRSERPRCKQKSCPTREEAEALVAKLISLKKKKLYVQKPVVIPCPLAQCCVLHGLALIRCLLKQRLYSCSQGG